MEGWLLVPPERNIIGRTNWKIRYVRFGTGCSSAGPPTRPSIPSSPVRPTTATGGKSSYFPIDRVSLHSPSLSNGHEAQAAYSVFIYKKKHDTEPIAQYPLHQIASCYVGDVASRQKKKSVILPTLVIHLRSETQPVSPRAFRRRSSEAVPKEGSRKEGTGVSTLLFRRDPESPNALIRWAKEIQRHLLPTATAGSKIVQTTIESTLQDKHTSCDNYEEDTVLTPSSSMFLINGEPSTALHSPSLRSRTSNLSSADSDDKLSLLSSAGSEFPSPTIEGEEPYSVKSEGRPDLHIATEQGQLWATSEAPIDKTTFPSPTSSGGTLPFRRETILDRYFANASQNPHPSTVPTTINSIARFEALMRELELKNPPDSSCDDADAPFSPKHPRQNSSLITSTSDDFFRQLESESRSRRPSILSPDVYSPTFIPGELSHRSSETSLGATSISGSTAGGSIHRVETNLTTANANVKRHSLADFSMVRVNAAQQLFGIASGPRRDSYATIPRASRSAEMYNDNGNGSLVNSICENHLSLTKPLFGDFSF